MTGSWKHVTLCAASLIAGCGVSKAATDRGLVARYRGCTMALQQGDWGAWEHGCLAPGFVRHDPESGDATGAAAREYWQRVKEAFPDVRLQPQVVLAADHEVFAILRVTGTHAGVLHCHGDWTASHKPIEVLVLERMRFDDTGHATDDWLYYDATTVLKQVGALLPETAQ